MSDARPSNPRDRPPGLAPKGTSWGFGLGVCYAFLAPTLAVLCLSVWMKGGVVSGLTFAMAFLPLYLVVMVVEVIGFKSRRYWGVWAYFCVGVFSAVALPVALVLVAAMLVLTLGHWPELVVLVWVYGAGLLVMALFWPLLIRGLRLRYWQPWTTPDQWETGDERMAGWAYAAGGAPVPGGSKRQSRRSVAMSRRPSER